MTLTDQRRTCHQEHRARLCGAEPQQPPAHPRVISCGGSSESRPRTIRPHFPKSPCAVSAGAVPARVAGRASGHRKRHPNKKDLKRVIKFQDLGLIEPLQRALAEEGYAAPTPIQAQAIPHSCRPRPARHRPDRHRQDRRVRAADPAAPRRRRRAAGAREGRARADPGPDARAGAADRRQLPRLRPPSARCAHASSSAASARAAGRRAARAASTSWWRPRAGCST